MKEFRHSSTAIREALPFVALSDIPAPYKSVLVEVVARALQNTESDERAAAARKRGGPWQTEEVQTLTAQLTGKVAVNWQHADEVLIGLAARLQRTPDEIKEKAKELGLGAGIDYRLARETAVRDAS
jgi:hypothetical protein